MSSNENLFWNARTDRRLVGIHGGQRHILVEVKAPGSEEPSRRRPPLNLGLVIDASGSMTGEPLEAARKAAIGVIDRLDAGDRITLVSFADDVIVHADAIAADEHGRRHALHALDRLETRGCTDLAAGWLAGCRCVAAAMDRQPLGNEDVGPTQNRVIVLSDGHANRGIVEPRELGRHASELRQRGLFSSTVGIGNGYSPVQLDAIAEHGGGRAHDAPLGEDIVAVVLGELGEIFETVAEDMTITVRPPTGMGIEVFGRYPVSQVGNDLRISLGSLVSGSSRQLVMQLTVPGGQIGDTHRVEIVPDWLDRDTGARRPGSIMSLDLAVATEAEVVSELPDMHVAQVVARMWENHLRLNSTLMNSEGRWQDAERLVRGAMPGFSLYCRDVPGTAELVGGLQDYQSTVGVLMEPSACLANVYSSKRAMKNDVDYRINKRS